MKKIALTMLGLTMALSLGACTKNNAAPSPSAGTTGTASPAVSASPVTSASPGVTTSPGVNTSPAATTPASPNTTASPGAAAGGAVNAESVFKQNCVSCHGVDLSGGVGPNLQKVGSRLSSAELTARISNGGGGMPPFKGTLKDEEITSLVQWLGTKK